MKWSAVFFALCGLLYTGMASAGDDGGSGQQRAARAGKSLIGQPGPAAKLTTIDGQKIDLAALYGKRPVYLKFWATWCVPCREQMPGFEALYKKYGKRIAVVAINAGYSETEEGVRAYREKFGLHMPIVIDDGSLAGKLNLRVTPQHIVIGADGRILHVGHLDDQELHAALEHAALTPAGASAIPLAPQSAEAPAFKIGDRVGGIAVTTMGGKTVSIGAGKPRALVFFSPWCESYLRDTRPATASACEHVRLETERLAKDRSIEWMGISSPLWTSHDELAAYAKEKHTSIPMALDQNGEIFRAFGIRQIPTVVLIDAQGRVSKIMESEVRL